MDEIQDLKSILCIGVVDDEELASLLLEHFRYAHGGETGDVAFYNPDRASQITLHYRDGKINSVDAKNLSAGESTRIAQKIKDELLDSPGTVAARCILFSTYRVTGSFSHGDKLKIFPVPDEAPRAPDLTEFNASVEHLIIEHPFVAEFPIKGSKNGLVRFKRLERQNRKFVLLLNLFLEGNITSVTRGRRRHWVHNGNPDIHTGYMYLREGYRYSDFGDMGPGFSQIEHISKMETMEYHDYFSNPRQELNPHMRIPALLGTFLDRFETLDQSDQKLLLRAAFWFQQAFNIWEESKSGSYLAIISSIETLLPRPRNTETCQKCGKPTGPGPTKLFRDFIEQLVPMSEIDKAARKKLYELRSALTHGGNIFYDDEEPIRVINPRATSEFSAHLSAMILAREVLLNWLMKKTGGWPSSDQGVQDDSR